MIRTVEASTRAPVGGWYDSFHAAAAALETFDSRRDQSDPGRCMAVVSTDLGVSVFEGDRRSTVDAFVHAVERALVAGGQAFVLGCARATGLDQRVVRTLRVPDGDRMAAAGAMARELAGLSPDAHRPMSPRFSRTEPR
ncbi:MULTISPECIES: racemase [unclassified Rhodococcus (in: high G+C Gram-positive bacteria)]|uniref:racemase n=1 Tax=unclassified Rhodococcus (in: high G+C Gram-positive bacteria) TaxID=192944 RepID=UPI002078CA17|nr:MULTISPECIES: racemase [unclassified Rhodococcus (in: high G+C Gram-positive bacteria)]